MNLRRGLRQRSGSAAPPRSCQFRMKGKNMKVFIVYCHPSSNSFTHRVKEVFIEGLTEAGHEVMISDLYADGFDPVISEAEYLREGFYNADAPVAADVIREQEKIDASDVIAFIYPDFWTASPAMLEGWFQRVWTFGYAYGPDRKMKRLKKALFFLTMGGCLEEPIRVRQLEAMKTVMIGDRIHDRADECEVYAFDQMTRGYANESNRESRGELFLRKVREIAASL